MNAEKTNWASLVSRVESLVLRLEKTLPPVPPSTDWSAKAFRWRKPGYLQAIPNIHPIRLSDLTGIDDQKAKVVANTLQFASGASANNVLLTGAKGSGKSSIIKALLHEFSGLGLRLIETDKADLVDLPEIISLIEGRQERFIVFCDDLSFDEGEQGYKQLKVALDGSLASPPENLLIYATSNRRHLLPEYMAENLQAHRVDDEIHPGEAMEEKISLSERFGLWLSFYPFDQDTYLLTVAHWLRAGGCSELEIRECERDALNWALARGSRSGRVANQFARDWIGMKQIQNPRHS